MYRLPFVEAVTTGTNLLKKKNVCDRFFVRSINVVKFYSRIQTMVLALLCLLFCYPFKTICKDNLEIEIEFEMRQ